VRTRRLIRIALVALCLPAAAAGAYATVAAETEARNQTALADSARDATEAVEAFLDGIERQVAWLGRPGASTPAVDTAYIFARVSSIMRLQFIDGRGHLVYEATRDRFSPADVDASHSRAFLAADPSAPWISPIRRIDGRPHADLAVTRAPEAGVAVADLDLSFLSDVLGAVHAPPGTRFALADDSGTAFAGATGDDETALVPIPRADWVLRATSGSTGWPPLLPLAERFVALTGILATIAWCGFHLGRRR
jgi:hypothetical protein